MFCQLYHFTHLLLFLWWEFLRSPLGFPGSSEVKASARSAGDLGLIPGLRKSTGEGNGSLLQYSCLQNPWTEEPSGLQSTGSQSQTWLSDFIFAFTFSATFKYTLLLDSVTIHIIPSLFFLYTFICMSWSLWIMLQWTWCRFTWDHFLGVCTQNRDAGSCGSIFIFLRNLRTDFSVAAASVYMLTICWSFKWSLPESRNVGSKNELAYCTLFQR